VTGPKRSETGLKHLPTHHLRHIAQSGLFGTPVLKQIFEDGSRRPFFITLSLQGISLGSLNSPWGVGFPKRPFGNQVFNQILEEGS